MRRTFAILLVLLIAAAAAPAGADEITLQEGTTIHLCDKDAAAEILGAVDAFMSRLSPFEISVRRWTKERFTQEQFASFAADQARPFTAEEEEKLRSIVASVRGKLEAAGIKAPFPPVINIVKTTGKEEAGAAYCRGNAIILSQKYMSAHVQHLEDCFIHELFHVLANANPNLRDDLYGIFGFRPCNEIALPEAIAPRRLTNPDALYNDHYIEITVAGEKLFVVPILLLDAEEYDPSSPGSFFDIMTPKLLVVQKRAEWESVLVDGKPRLLDFSQAPDYLDKLGGNTPYVIHPEEVLAANFELLVKGKQPSSSPRIPDMLRELLARQEADKH